ncbi:MAG: glycyl-radical enzyme activating protein [Bifidobacteriaceae bacterium]|jgi:pyruvate formate lyase activating enzyme|nr:glycyl-radical enzyme activating protein [Bifidobacteriaceae bacterium]
MQKGLIFNIQKFSINDGSGIRTNIFMKGCPLVCEWCSNPESQLAKPQMLGDTIDSKEYSVQEVVEICLKDKVFYDESDGGITVTGGEPLVQHKFVSDLLDAFHTEGVNTAMETTAHASKSVFTGVTPKVDQLLCDIKHYDSAVHKQKTGVGNERILENIKWALENHQNLLMRIPVIPDFNSTLDDADSFADLLNNLGIMRVQLLPFHQFGAKKYELLGMNYAYKGIKALYPEDLTDYAERFTAKGVDAFF